MKVSVYTTCLNDRIMLVKEKELEYPYNGRFSDPESIAFMMTEAFHMNQFAEEYVYMLAFTNSLNLIGVSEVFHGTVSACTVSPREIFVRACLMGASVVAIVHNHTSESHEPSSEDFAVTRRLIEAGKLMNIPLIDHVIIANNKTSYSFRYCNSDLFS
ncbi:MAG: JAB domain-containing protein [Blautia sp.]|nr:JAB domain-containing protein [Blautia sp.]